MREVVCSATLIEDDHLHCCVQRLRDEEVRSKLDEQARELVNRQRRMVRREMEHDLNITLPEEAVDFGDRDQEQVRST